jgi:hypothetical protein
MPPRDDRGRPAPTPSGSPMSKSPAKDLDQGSAYATDIAEPLSKDQRQYVDGLKRRRPPALRMTALRSGRRDPWDRRRSDGAA